MIITTHSAELCGELATWHQYGEGTPRFHFLAANGFPVRSYDYFLRSLATEGTVFSLENRGIWHEKKEPDCEQGWQLYVDDLLEFLVNSGVSASRPIIAVGHSLGASVSLLAALQEPSLFKGLVLVDPASNFSDEDRIVWDSGINAYPPDMVNRLVKAAKKRQTHWARREDFREYLITRSAYSKFTSQTLDDYVWYGLELNEEGYSLAYSPSWEAHTFKTSPEVLPLFSQVTVPTLFLHGEKSFLYTPQKMALIFDWFASTVAIQPVVKASHLALQENPEFILKSIHSWLPRQVF